MGSKWFTGGVAAAPRGKIQFDFIVNGIRYRPSIKRPPSEANLRRARERLEAIKQQIHLGTFSFEEEFPNYRFLHRRGGTSGARLCSDVFDAYLAHCEARLRRNDMAAATVRSYRKILDSVWSPHLGDMIFSHIQYSRLIVIADGHSWSKKTRAPGPCHVTPIRRRRISASPGPIRRSRGKSHFVSSIEEGGAAWESSLAARGTQHMRRVVRLLSDPKRSHPRRKQTSRPR